MEIPEIREKAIPYYACFIARQMNSDGASLTLEAIHRDSWTDDHPPRFLLNDLALIELAIDFLENKDIVRSITDEFAPRIVIQHQNFRENLTALHREDDTVFDRYRRAGEGRIAWLEKALRNISDRMEEARENEEDDDDDEIAEPGESDDSWAPIPLDRTDQFQDQATRALDAVIEELRGDNGYATAHPEEKAFVQDKLSAVRRRLREDTQISWMYLLEFALKPLAIVIKRYGGAAIGVTAATAKDALASWLKTKGISFLDDLFK